MIYDKIIIGAGLYGLYSALHCGRRGENVLVLEKEDRAFRRATYINQARVHMGYHYPRSLSTAVKSRGYFDRFCRDYPDSIKRDFTQIYATGRSFSWTDAARFKKFCRDRDIPCKEVPASDYFNEGTVDGAFLTKEYTYDRRILRDGLLADIEKTGNVTLSFSNRVTGIRREGDVYIITDSKGEERSAPFVLNASYASVNCVNAMAGFEPFPIKYELCEIILCKVNDAFKDVGITVMDGPFFSIMPFGKTGFHSLTSVTFTPHVTSYDSLPTFRCQKGAEDYCRPESLGNCDGCPHKPRGAWGYMSRLARKYLKKELEFTYSHSLFSMKPILKMSEIDDSRPTMIKVESRNPTFVSVLSGKINTVYDLEEVLSGEP